jgi:Tfp pilus assembly protein PilO
MKNIYSILLIIITGVVFFLAVDPFYKEVKEIKEDISTYDNALDNSTELQRSRDDLVSVYNNIRDEDKEKLKHLLPDNIGNIELILEIEKIANLHGMPIGDIEFDARTLDGGEKGGKVAQASPKDFLPYGVFPMKFKVTGKYESFISFLKELEQNLRIVDVKSIDFKVPGAIVSSDGRVTENDIYDYTLKIETYWLK